jgi:hypothetical protein
MATARGYFPKAISLYLEFQGGKSSHKLSDIFAKNATVRDESKMHEGLYAIQIWKEATDYPAGSFLER